VSIVVGITEISAIVAAAGVLVGVVYYVLQLRHQSRVRQTELVMRLYSQFTSIEFQKLWEEVLKSEAKDLDDYRNKFGMAKLWSVGLFFEGIGILLKRKLIDIELVDDMFTTPIEWTWLKIRKIVLEARKVGNQPEILEWFEYLYNEMKRREQKLQQSKAEFIPKIS
jgi:hypothetical protein